MPRASREASEATAAAILSHARRLFAERGFAAATLDEIAAAAGVTRGAVYHHYGSGKGLFAAVLESVQADVAAEIDRATAGLSDPWQSLKLGSRAFLRSSVEPAVQRVLLIDGPAVVGWERWRRGDAEHSARMLDDVMAELERTGQLRAPAAAASALLSGAMNEAALWIAESGDSSRALAEAGATLDLLVEALRA